MRIGDNESRDKRVAAVKVQHRVIIPLYIPHETDYYEDAFPIFKMCVQSIKAGAVDKVPITVIANGCSHEIHEKLLALVPLGLIDELFVETEQLGKINSIRKAIQASEEHFLTITDGDVLFLNDWDRAVCEVFTAFPQATAVAPVPIHKTFNQYVTNIWFDYLFSKDIAFAKAKNPQALEQFVKSIGWPHLNDSQKLEILTLKAANGIEAVVGCSHFCTTYRKEVFKFAPQEPTQFTLSGDSEKRYLDLPTIQANGYRLSTATNHAYHLGNVLEPWMEESFNTIVPKDKILLDWPPMRPLKKSRLRYTIKNKLFKKLLTYPYFYNAYLLKCGINPAWKTQYFK